MKDVIVGTPDAQARHAALVGPSVEEAAKTFRGEIRGEIMTREEILAMVPGRKLDCLIAEKVFGKTVDGDICEDQTFPQWNGDFLFFQDQEGKNVPLPHYSTDMVAAWEVVEKIRQDKFNVEVLTRADGKCFVTCKKVGSITDILFEVWAKADSAPEAICKAALLARLATK